MKKAILVSMLSLVFLVFVSPMYIKAQWTRTYGGSNDEYIFCIQQTSDKGYIIAGETYSFGAGDADAWILKLSEVGEIEWQKTYGGSGYDSARFIQQTSDGGYIATAYTWSFGVGYSDFWVFKLSSTGAIEWQKTYGGSGNDGANCIRQTKDGGYIIAGGTYSFGAGSDDAWILKLSSTGDIQWQKTYGGSGIDSARVIQQTTDSGYIVTGCTESFGAGYADVWVLKLSSTGDIQWQKTYGGYMNDSNLSYQGFIQQTSDGGYIATAYTWSFGVGYSDFWVFKLSSTGAIEWQKTYGGASNYDTPYFIQQTAGGGYIVTGFTDSFGSGEDDVWILRLSSTGDIEWQKTYGGSDYDYATFLQQTSEGGYIVGANTYSAGAGNRDLLILKLYPDGDIAPSCGLIGISSASVTNTYVLPANTYVTPQNTSVTPMPSNASPLDTYASSDLLCEALKYTLTISANTGGTTDPTPGTYTHYDRTSVSITAIPNSGYRFSGWSGAVTGTTNPIVITMDGDKSITANFIRQYTLTIAAGTGGTTTPSPGTYKYDSGAQVSITATANSGYQFSGWSGNASGTTNPITITMDSDKSVTANFTATTTTSTGGGGKKGGCFIATAAYGSPLHSHVNILRDFRDKYLIPTKVGRALVNLYYKYSPSVADLIAKHKALKFVIRVSLLPFVAFSYSMVHFGLIITTVISMVIFALSTFIILIFRKK
jgi:uncharacterized repeat protein (TIGR02543 family)